MSAQWITRLSIYSFCFVATLVVVNLETVQAQRPNLTPPGGGPPAAGGRGGGPPAAQGEDRANDPKYQRPVGNQRPSSVGNRGGGMRGGAPAGNARNDRGNSKSKRAKFINLLDTKDLSNFRGYVQEEIGEGWSLDGKALYFDGSGGGDIITKETYGDFDLQVEWKVADGANSGIMYRVSLGDSAPYMSGPEYQVLDDAEHEDGKNPTTSAGSLYAMYAPQGEKKLKEVGTWNKTRIIVEGNKVTHFLNSVKVVEAEIGSEDWNAKLGESKFKDWEKFAKNSEGHIAFQDHGNEVWFRNIRVKRLGDGAANATAEPDDGGRPSPRGAGTLGDEGGRRGGRPGGRGGAPQGRPSGRGLAPPGGAGGGPPPRGGGN